MNIAPSLEVSKHAVVQHMQGHSYFLDVQVEVIKMLNVIIELECCEKSSLIICAICGDVLFIRLKTPGDVCECIKEMFE